MEDIKNMEEEANSKMAIHEHQPSGMYISFHNTIPEDILEFDYSFGYNAKKYNNLCLVDPGVLAYVSGNFIHFFHISTKEMTFRRSELGQGIGFMTKNPSSKIQYMAVAENGKTPTIFIYKFPSFELISTLVNGAEKSFSYLTYDPEGKILASQAGDPDYMITIWNWKTSTIILKTKAFTSEVIKVVFSSHNPSLLTTCGFAHIKFWKKAKTFTGLKLQGELGRFGKTEMSDIYATLPLADEKVVSGCEWGNMLVWEGGLIKFEVCRKGRKKCHKGPIAEITMNNEQTEVTTVGMDGYIRIWFWETVELADPPDEDRFVEIEPMYEFHIGAKDQPCEIRDIIKAKPSSAKDYDYYIQDGNSGIWYCELHLERKPKPSVQLFACHSGKILTMDSSPNSTHIATMDNSGKLHIYDYVKKKLCIIKQFSLRADDILWFPAQIDPTGCTILIGFEDGVLRQIAVNLEENVAPDAQRVFLVDCLKPHTEAISHLSIDPRNTVLVSCSRDKSFFVYKIKKSTKSLNKIVPIGLVKLQSIPNAINWKPSKGKKDKPVVILGCTDGLVVECSLPDEPARLIDEAPSYVLNNVKLKTFAFKSIKSMLRRQALLEIKNKKRQEKLAQKIREYEEFKRANPGVEVDEQTFLSGIIDDEEEEEPLYIPKEPNPILWLQYTPNNTIWISVAGYDAGYIYECILDGRNTVANSTMIFEGDDIEIYSYLYWGDEYLIFGLEDGSLRVNRIKNDFHDLSDYYQLPMHDSLNGVIPKIKGSYDGKNVFSIGHDGNIFMYSWTGPIPEESTLPKRAPFVKPDSEAKDIKDKSYYSLEQKKNKKAADKRKKLADEHKEEILGILAGYRKSFDDTLGMNRLLPPRQQLTVAELELDSRITDDLVATLDKEFGLVRRRLEFNVEKSTLGKKKVYDYFVASLDNFPIEVNGLRKNIYVKTFRMNKLSKEFYSMKKEIGALTELDELIKKAHASPRRGREEKKLSFGFGQETFLMGLTAEEIQERFTPKMRRLLQRNRERRKQKILREYEWEIVRSQRPDTGKNYEEDDLAIEEAQRTIGYYQMKLDPEFGAKEIIQTSAKYKQILEIQEKLFNMRKEYNNKVENLRDEKAELLKYIEEKKAILARIHKQLPKNERRAIPPLLEVNYDKERPEEKMKEQIQRDSGIDIKDYLYKNPNSTPLEPNNNGPIIKTTSAILEEMEHEIFFIDDDDDQLNNVRMENFRDLCNEIEAMPKILTSDYKQLIGQIERGGRTAWELEIQYDHIVNNCIQQHQILQDIEVKVKDFDSKLEKLLESRINVEIRVKFLECFLITCNLELSILKDCMNFEREMVLKIGEHEQERDDILDSIDDCKRLIVRLQKENDKMNVQIKQMHTQFMNQIRSHQFFDFLRKIFKKRFKPPKIRDPEDEEESSSEEDSDDSSSSGVNVDDDEEHIMKSFMDERFCPAGLDKKTYEWSFAMRSDRQLLEENIYKNQLRIEQTKGEITVLQKSRAETENRLKDQSNKLASLRRQRRDQLNKIETIVFLRMDQLQYYFDQGDINDFSNVVLFVQPILKELRTRVGELNVECKENIRHYQVNIVHLKRMNTDCERMQSIITQKKTAIEDAMINKFGEIVDLDELEEGILKRYVFELKAEAKDLKKSFEQQLSARKKILEEKEKELIKITQMNTEKLNILTVLQEEKNYLIDMLNYQKKFVKKLATSPPVDFTPDVGNLKRICKQQEEQIELLEKEITTLRLRTKPLHSPRKIEIDGTEHMEILPPSQQPAEAESQSPTTGEQAKSERAEEQASAIVLDKAVKIIEKFLLKKVGHDCTPEGELQTYTMKIAKYFEYLRNSFAGTTTSSGQLTEKHDKIVRCVVENIKGLLPQKYLIRIKEDNIKALFKDVMDAYEYECTDISLDEIINGIVVTVVESKPDSGDETNFTQNLMIDIFKELVEVLTLNDLADAQTVPLLTKALRAVPTLKPHCINVQHLVEVLVEYIQQNHIDDMVAKPIRDIAEHICRALDDKGGKCMLTEAKIPPIEDPRN